LSNTSSVIVYFPDFQVIIIEKPGPAPDPDQSSARTQPAIADVSFLYLTPRSLILLLDRPGKIDKILMMYS
jgi:hypothetical protein